MIPKESSTDGLYDDGNDDDGEGDVDHDDFLSLSYSLGATFVYTAAPRSIYEIQVPPTPLIGNKLIIK